MLDGATDNGKQGVSPPSRANGDGAIDVVHLPGSDSAQARARNELAVATTDRGVKLTEYREGDVDYALTLLIRNGGNRFTAMVKQLAEAEIVVTKRQLRDWRDRVFRSRYFLLRQELAPEIEAGLAGSALERAAQADRVQELVLRLAESKADEIPPKDLPRAAQALATAKASDIEKSRLLRDKPTEIKETRSVEELVLTLKRLEVLSVKIDGQP